jgi:hypothetical protein
VSDRIHATDERFYSPAAVHHFAEHARTGFANAGKPVPAEVDKLILETTVTAIFAADFAARIGLEMWLRPVDPRQQAPDVEIIHHTLEDVGFVRQVLLVEVVSYTYHTDESLEEFLLRTKLDGRRAYPSNTIILVHAERSISRQEITHTSSALSNLTGFPPVFLCNCVDENLHQVIGIYPRLTEVGHVRLTELLASEQPLALDTHRGLSREGRISEEPISTPNPFLQYL